MADQTKMDELSSALAIELRKGTTVLSVLSKLAEPRYGYELSQDLEANGVSADTNTLYPLLRRLEGQGILESLWNTEESKPRKYYRRTGLGDLIYENLRTQWNSLKNAIDNLLEEGK